MESIVMGSKRLTPTIVGKIASKRFVVVVVVVGGGGGGGWPFENWLVPTCPPILKAVNFYIMKSRNGCQLNRSEADTLAACLCVSWNSKNDRIARAVSCLQIDFEIASW